MAKLSAHGNELVRMELERDVVARSENSRVIWERRTVALMSDGVLLSKYDVRFAAGPQGWDMGGFHSYGWKKAGGKHAVDAEVIKKFRDVMAAKGYKEVK